MNACLTEDVHISGGLLTVCMVNSVCPLDVCLFLGVCLVGICLSGGCLSFQWMSDCIMDVDPDGIPMSVCVGSGSLVGVCLPGVCLFIQWIFVCLPDEHLSA